MNDAEFTKFSGSILRVIRKNTPKKTGNLRKHATRIIPKGAGRFEIVVEERIAPYFKYVNGTEERKGSHHGYFDKAVKGAVKTVAKKYGGRVVGV